MLEVRILFGFLFARIRDMNAIVRDMFGYGFCGWTVRTDFVRISYFVRILYVLGFCVLLVQNCTKTSQNLNKTRTCLLFSLTENLPKADNGLGGAYTPIL